MGMGIDLARIDAPEHAPEHAAARDNMKDQLLICLIKRLVLETKTYFFLSH